MRRRPKPIDPAPLIMRGENEFEEKRIKCDFELVFKQVSELGLISLKDTYEFVYRKAFVAGKVAALHKQSGVAVAENAEPQKGPNT